MRPRPSSSRWTMSAAGTVPAPSVRAIAPEAAAPTPAASADKPAEPTELEVAWKSCTLRDAPRTGTPVGKVSRGTKVKVVDKKGDWLKVVVLPSKQEGWMIKTATEK